MTPLPVDRHGRVETGERCGPAPVPRWSASSRPTRRSAPASPSPRSPSAAARGRAASRRRSSERRAVSRSTSGPGAADLLTRERAQVRRARPASGCSWCATGPAGRRPGPEDDRGDPRVSGPLDVPGAVATAAALVARTAEMADEAGRLRRFTEQVRRAAASDPGRASPRRPRSRRSPAPPGQHVVPLRRRRGAAGPAGSARGSPPRAAPPAPPAACRPATSWRPIGALTHGNLRVSLGRDTRRGRRRPAAGACCPAPWPSCAPRRAWPGCDGDAARTVDSRGRRCPLPIIDLARQRAMPPTGPLITLLADDPAAAADVAAWCRMRGQSVRRQQPG